MSVEKLAAKSALSERQLHRLFESTLGMSPLQALRQAKVEVSMELLRTCKDPVTLIAEKAGFSSLAQFNSTFRQITAKTPSAFRKSSI